MLFDFGWQLLSFSTLNMSFFSLAAYRVYAEKPIDSLFGDSFVGYLNFSLVASSLLIFYWSIALQCCTSFCSTVKLISCMYTYIPSLLDLPPTHSSGSSQSTKPGFQCFVAGFPLAILHMVVYICQPSSPSSSPTPPSPTPSPTGQHIHMSVDF